VLNSKRRPDLGAVCRLVGIFTSRGGLDTHSGARYKRTRPLPCFALHSGA